MNTNNVGTIPDNWHTKKISEIAEVVTDYVANGSFASLAQNVHYYNDPNFAVLIRLADYNNGFKGNFVFIDEHAYNFLAKTKLYGGEIIISNVGANVGTVFKCPNLKYKMSLAPNSIVVKFNGNNDFYFYWLKGYYGQQALQSIVTGSAQPKFNKTNFKDLYVPVPPLEIQNKIASVLNALDSKIEQNTAINNNLEQQAQALFQQYFGGKDPNGSINDILDEMPKSKIKVGDAKDVRGPYPFFTSGQNILEYTEALVDGRNIFLNTGGNADVKYYIGPAAYSTDTWCIKAKNNMTDMLYLLLKGMQTELDSIYFEGSALRHLQKPKLKSLAIYIPTDEELKTFNSIVASLFNKIAANVAENKILEHTRDALLPKLMSGEIDVSKVDISDPEHLSLFDYIEG